MPVTPSVTQAGQGKKEPIIVAGGVVHGFAKLKASVGLDYISFDGEDGSGKSGWLGMR